MIRATEEIETLQDVASEITSETPITRGNVQAIPDAEHLSTERGREAIPLLCPRCQRQTVAVYFDETGEPKKAEYRCPCLPIIAYGDPVDVDDNTPDGMVTIKAGAKALAYVEEVKRTAIKAYAAIQADRAAHPDPFEGLA